MRENTPYQLNEKTTQKDIDELSDQERAYELFGGSGDVYRSQLIKEMWEEIQILRNIVRKQIY